MSKKQLFQPSDLNLRVNFTTVKTTINPVNGHPEKGPVVLFTKYGAFRRRSLTQQYSIQGTSLEDTVIIGVRHDARILKTLGITIKGINYKIIDISTDESNTYIAYDLITVKVVTK